MDKSSVDSFRNRFHNNFDLYLKEQCEFYNLDVVISLPLNERTEMRMENNDLSNIPCSRIFLDKKTTNI